MSLRTSMLLLGVGGALTGLLLFAVPLAVVLQRDARETSEQRAATAAQGVADYASAGSRGRPDLEAYLQRVNDRDDVTPVTLVEADGTTLGARDRGCAPPGEAASPSTPAEGEDGTVRGAHEAGEPAEDDQEDHELAPLSTVAAVDVIGGRLMRVEASTPADTIAVCAWVSDNRVDAAAGSRAGWLALMAGLILAGVAGVSLLAARRIARPLSRAALTADRLGGGELDARADESGPHEVRRVASALNRLARRIEELLSNERESVADLSHRLRTPLMALRLDVDALPDSAAKSDLETHLSQLERSLTMLITLARRPQREGAAPACVAADVVRDRFEFWLALWEDQGRAATLEVDDGAGGGRVRSTAADLAAALDALMENATAHTAEGVAVAVRLVSAHEEFVIEVADQGPGVPATALERGHSDRGSSGLGLDIARACAEAAGGRLELDRAAPWSMVRLVLPRSIDAAAGPVGFEGS